MSEAATTEPDILTPDPRISEGLDTALLQADAQFKRLIAKHDQDLKKPKVVAALRRNIDIPERPFSLQGVMQEHMRQRTRLVEKLKDADTTVNLYEALRDHIEDEISRLFFLTNDFNQAELAADYFGMFLKEALPTLQAKGLITETDRQELHQLDDYYTILLETYETMREEIRERTQGETSSLVKYALLFGEDESATVDEDMALLEDADAINDSEKSAAIKARSIAAYTAILDDHDMSYRGEQQPHPSILWLKKRVDLVSSLESIRILGPNATRQEAEQEAPNRALRMRSILNQIGGVIQEQGNVIGLILAKVSLEDLEMDAGNAPDTMLDILNNALGQAGELTLAAKKTFLSEDAKNNRGKPVPESQQIGNLLWPGLTQEAHAYNDFNDAVHNAAEHIGTARSIQAVMARADEFVDRMGERVFTAFEHPATLLFMRQYLSHLRKALAEDFLDAGKFSINQDAFGRLANVEKKCQHLYDSYQVMRSFLFEASSGAFDAPTLQAYTSMLAKTPRLISNLEPKDILDELMPTSYDVMDDVLKEMDIYRNDSSLLLPLFYKRAVDVAHAIHGEPPAPGAPNEEIDAYSERVTTEAKRVYHKTISLLPRQEPYTGERIKAHSFTAEETALVMDAFEDQCQLPSMDRRRLN